MKKKLLLTAVVLGLAFSLAGCVKSDDVKPMENAVSPEENGNMMVSDQPQASDTPETLEADLNSIKLEEETFQ